MIPSEESRVCSEGCYLKELSELRPQRSVLARSLEVHSAGGYVGGELQPGRIIFRLRFEGDVILPD